MTLFLLFVSAQLFGNGIACLIAAVAWHFTRPRLVDIGKTARIDTSYMTDETDDAAVGHFAPGGGSC